MHIKIRRLLCSFLMCHCRLPAIRGEDSTPPLLRLPSFLLLLPTCNHSLHLCVNILDHFTLWQASWESEGAGLPCSAHTHPQHTLHQFMEKVVCAFQGSKDALYCPLGVQPHFSFLSLQHLLVLSLLLSRAVPSLRAPHTVSPMHVPGNGPSLVH